MAAPILLPTLVQNIVLNPAGVKGGANAYTQSMAPVNKTTKMATQNMAAMGSSLNTLAFRAQTTGRMLLTRLALPMAAIGGVAIKSFASFEESMVKIEALVGVSAGGVERFTEAVKETASATGRGPQELADAMFFVSSAGLRGASAMEVMEASAKGAAIGLGKTAVVADAATSAVNAYGAENLNGSAAVDVLTAAVREGKVEANRLAPAIGKAIPVASAMGIEFHEVAAAISAMTRTGTDARTSAIQLRQIMQSLLDPSRQATKAMREMGIAEGELRRQAREEGLLAVLKRLRDLASENEDAFADVFPNIRALAGALDITGANLKENEGIFQRLSESVGDTDEALKKVQDTAAFRTNKAFTDLKNSMVELGEALLPLLGVFLKIVGVATAVIKVFSSKWVAPFAVAAITLTATIGALLLVVGQLGTSFAFMSMAQASATATTGTLAIATNWLSAAMVRLSLTMKAVPVLALIGVLTAAITVFVGLGRKGRSASEALSDLAAEIADVRLVGEHAIKPILDFADAIASVKAVGDAEKTVEQFKQTFQELIDTASDVDKVGGMLQAEESLLSAFFGRGDTPEVQQALKSLITEYRNAFGQKDFFNRMFDPLEGSVDDAIGRFLSGENGEDVARLQVGLWTERFLGEARRVVEGAQASWLSTLSTLGVLAPGGIRELAVNQARNMRHNLEPLSEAMVEPLTKFDDLVRSGNLAEALLIRSEMVSNLAEDFERMGITSELAFAIADRSFTQALSGVDNFSESADDAVDSFDQRLRHLATTGVDVGKAFTGDDWYRDFAEQYVIASEIINRNPLHGDLSEMDRQNLALELAEIRLRSLGDAYLEMEDAANSAGDTVGDAMQIMQTGFDKADKAAKSLQTRFDNLIGRALDLRSSNLDFNDSLQEMADSLYESGGAIDSHSASGRDAQAAIIDQISGAQDYAAAILEAGGSTEDAEAQFKSFLGSITATALSNSVDADALQNLFRDLNLTPENISVMFADDDDTASDALMESAKKMSERTQNFLSDKGHEIGADTMLGVQKGLKDGEQSVLDTAKGIFDALVRASRGWLGISSPSVVFAKDVGRPITAGIAKGVLDERSKLRDALRELVDDALSVARTRTGVVSRALSAVFDLEDTRKKLEKMQRDFGGAGETTKRERLTNAALKRAKSDAERALRLGQGHQEDLELALLDAQEALADFESSVTSGSPVAKAELELMDAGTAVAESQAAMKMEGDKAIEMFSNLAETMGLNVGRAQELLEMGGEGETIFERMFSDDVKQAIKDVAAGLGLINTELDDMDGEDGKGVVVQPIGGGSPLGDMFTGMAGASPEVANTAEVATGAYSLGVQPSSIIPQRYMKQLTPTALTNLAPADKSFANYAPITVNVYTDSDSPLAVGDATAAAISRTIREGESGGLVANSSYTPAGPSRSSGASYAGYGFNPFERR